MIRTGSIGLDIALKGGWPEGTLNEIWGDTGAGKTVLALHAVESMTRAGKHTVWIDTVDGVAHMDSAPQVIVCRPRYAEDVFMVTNAACAEDTVGLVVIDSANMLVRERELNDSTYVPHPQREYKTELALLKAEARDSRTTVLFVSQPRDKEREPIRGTGISEKVKYRVHLHPDVVHQDGTREIQATVKDVPGKKVIHDAARFTVRPGQGIDWAREMVEMAAYYGIVSRRASWFEYKHLREHGITDMARAIEYNPVLSYELQHDIRASAGIA
jgi:recombination protein RecA